MNSSSEKPDPDPPAIFFRKLANKSTLAFASSAPASSKSKNLSSLPSSFLSEIIGRELAPNVAMAKHFCRFECAAALSQGGTIDHEKPLERRRPGENSPAEPESCSQVEPLVPKRPS